MENSEKIKEFMSKIQDEWSMLKKARYICLKLCEIYNYNPEYAYGDSKQQEEVLKNSIFNVNANDSYVICLSLATLYKKCLEQAGFEGIIQLGGDIIINLNDDDELQTIVVSIEKELYPTKTKSEPKGFEGSDEATTRKLKEETEKIDKELGHIDENGYTDLAEISDSNKIEELTTAGMNYMAKTVKVPLQGVHLHQFFKHLLRTSLPNLKFKIFPLFKKNMENITYALITSEKSGFEVYLYNDLEQRFKQTTMEEIKSMVNSGYNTSDKRKKGLMDYIAEI